MKFFMLAVSIFLRLQAAACTGALGTPDKFLVDADDLDIQLPGFDHGELISTLDVHDRPPPNSSQHPNIQPRGKQPPAASVQDFQTAIAKGCDLLYLMSANAGDALKRMKLNPKLAGLTSSQSKFDNAGDLKTYGWTEKSGNVNWAYMGINDVGIPKSIPFQTRCWLTYAAPTEGNEGSESQHQR